MALNSNDLPQLVELLNMIDIRVKARRKTAAEWVSSNEVLLPGEWGIELGTWKAKLGNGVDGWNSLAFFTTENSQDSVTALAITSGAVDIDCALGDYFTLSLTSNVTSITFSNLPDTGKAKSIRIRMQQDGTGDRLVALPGELKALLGSETQVSPYANSYSVLSMTSVDQGSRWEYFMRHMAPGDVYFANVVALLHFDGIDGSTVFPDVKAHSWSAAGNAQIDTAQSVFGGASALFDGSGDSIIVASSSVFSLGTGDFTIEFHARPANVSAGYRTLVADNVYGSAGGWALYQNGADIELWKGGAVAVKIVTGSSVLTAATWVHVAWVREAGVNYIFADGVLEDSASDSTNFTSPRVQIGRNVGGNYFNGHIDEFRITKGVARYTSGFTPPTEAYPNG